MKMFKPKSCSKKDQISKLHLPTVKCYFENKIKRSNKSTFTVLCINENCKWCLRATMIKEVLFLKLACTMVIALAPWVFIAMTIGIHCIWLLETMLSPSIKMPTEFVYLETSLTIFVKSLGYHKLYIYKAYVLRILLADWSAENSSKVVRNYHCYI